MRSSDAILYYRRAATAAKLVMYVLLYASPLVLVADRTLRMLALSIVPILVIVCAVTMAWASNRAEALQHELNVRIK